MVATYAWLAGGEIPSQRLRSYTFGLAAAIGFLGAWVTTFTAPYFINPESLNWGPKYGYIWFPSGVVSAVWVWFFLPELKGRTLEEIDEMVCFSPCSQTPPSLPSAALFRGSLGTSQSWTNWGSRSSWPSCQRESSADTSASGTGRPRDPRRAWKELRCRRLRRRRTRTHSFWLTRA